ncbi:MAG: hypothetical protein IKN69_00335, partial [Bacilli bacterium]|nr:hypothetical protein [Bacilli bacterium]
DRASPSDEGQYDNTHAADRPLVIKAAGVGPLFGMFSLFQTGSFQQFFLVTACFGFIDLLLREIGIEIIFHKQIRSFSRNIISTICHKIATE